MPIQRFFRHFRGNQRVTVTVPAYPITKSNFWPGIQLKQSLGIKALIFPSLNHASVHHRNDLRKYIGQVVKNVSELRGNIRFFQEDFPGFPKSVKRLLDIVTDVFHFLLRVHLVFHLHNQEIQFPMMLQNSSPLSLSRVSCKYRLYTNILELDRNVSLIYVDVL